MPTMQEIKKQEKEQEERKAVANLGLELMNALQQLNEKTIELKGNCLLIKMNGSGLLLSCEIISLDRPAIVISELNSLMNNYLKARAKKTIQIQQAFEENIQKKGLLEWKNMIKRKQSGKIFKLTQIFNTDKIKVTDNEKYIGIIADPILSKIKVVPLQKQISSEQLVTAFSDAYNKLILQLAKHYENTMTVMNSDNLDDRSIGLFSKQI